MKKYITFMAAALMFAACTKEEVNIQTDETEFVSVELNIATKTALDGFNTKWSDGDKVSVTGTSHLGYLEYDSETQRFSGYITKGQNGTVTLNYPVDDNNKAITNVPDTQTAKENSFAEGAALLQGSITVENLRKGNGTTLQNKVALLEFYVAKAGSVTFELGSKQYTINGCQVGKKYYACVEPTNNVAVSFKATSDGYTIKKASNPVTFDEGKISILGTLPYNIYLHAKTGRYDWTSDGARFASWTWGGGQQDCWIDFVKDEDHEGVYRIEIPQGYTGAKFCRMNPNTDNGWDNSQNWNNSGNLTLPTDDKNHYYIKSSNGGEWGTTGHQLPILICFELNTDNSKKYWGDTSYLYIEVNSERPTGSWPGTKMNKVGEHRWEYEIPATYRTKKCYYQIHNNNGWIGKQTVTVSSYEYVFWGQNMGVN